MLRGHSAMKSTLFVLTASKKSFVKKADLVIYSRMNGVSVAIMHQCDFHMQEKMDFSICDIMVGFQNPVKYACVHIFCKCFNRIFLVESFHFKRLCTVMKPHNILCNIKQSLPNT